MALGSELIFLIIIGINTFSDYDISDSAYDENQISGFRKLLVTMQGLVYYPNLLTFAVLEVAWKARIKDYENNQKGKNSQL